MTLSIRPFSPSDAAYRQLMAIQQAIYNEPPEPLDVWKHYDHTWNPDYPYLRELVYRDGQLIGFVETFQNPFAYHPQKYECRMFIHPDHDAPDVRPFILQHTLDRLADRDLIALTSGMVDDKPHAMQFFEDYGFVPTQTEKLSKLALRSFDESHFADVLDRVAAAGIDIYALRHLQTADPDWARKLYDLEITVNPDIPSTGEKHYPPFEAWREARLVGPKIDPDGWYVAVHDGVYVGQSSGYILPESEPLQFDSSVTSTRRTYRRKGIATALKLHVIRYARAQGVQQILTTNDAHNPMYQLNLSLGFQPMPSWVRVEKALGVRG